mmetsp:Transcript_16289/g.16223  ORF Transcript_16289/g.16223 Transcript_16289/m.16223 type:complete len:81 (+) Transcript_16289:842-1084(+)
MRGFQGFTKNAIRLWEHVHHSHPKNQPNRDASKNVEGILNFIAIHPNQVDRNNNANKTGKQNDKHSANLQGVFGSHDALK